VADLLLDLRQLALQRRPAVKLCARRSRSRASARSTASSIIRASNALLSDARTSRSMMLWAICTPFAQTVIPRFWWYEQP
jgi:hypothetical protein